MTIKSVIAQYLSFIRGERLVDGGDCLNLAYQVNGYLDSRTALAGGLAPGATPLSPGSNRFTTVATAADSALLPPAVPFQTVVVVNDGAASMRVFPCQSNPNNAGAADTIAPGTSSTYGASADIGTHETSVFYCIALGKWKQNITT